MVDDSYPTYLLMDFQVWMDIYGLPVPGSGGKTCSQIFEEAGCDTPASPSCAACLGGPKDTYARMNEPLVSSLPLPEYLITYKCSSNSTSVNFILLTLKELQISALTCLSLKIISLHKEISTCSFLYGFDA